MKEQKLVWEDNITNFGKENKLFELSSTVKSLKINFFIRNWGLSRGFSSENNFFLLWETDGGPSGVYSCNSVEEAKEKAEEHYFQSILQNQKPSFGIDAETELLNMLGKELYEPQEEKYLKIKEILNIESFMNATNNNLDMLFKYMFSPTKGIRLSNIQVAEFIKDEYGDDFFYRREMFKIEESERENKK